MVSLYLPYTVFRFSHGIVYMSPSGFPCLPPFCILGLCFILYISLLFPLAHLYPLFICLFILCLCLC
ncbi:hypothetical protein BC829DRAFT_393115 [Chytridium lagenaria]|nr:hypothetical protein BC829DRAFT_393115 [Chytridium lagenaria]